MGLLDEIERALGERALHPGDVELCATTLLRDVYPGLAPIAGGTDFGRDADIEGTGEVLPPRLLVTTGDPRANLVSGLDSMRANGIQAETVVVAATRPISATKLKNLHEVARPYGVTKVIPHSRPWWIGTLYRHPEWRLRLLGIAGDPPSLVSVPLQLLDDPWGDLGLIGRSELLERLRTGDNDVLLVGGPGLGKTRVAGALPDAVFLERTEPARVADELRHEPPTIVVVDDAHLRVDGVELLRRCRAEEQFGFRILALTWPDEVEALAAALPGVSVIALDQLEQGHVDEIVQTMGITSHYLRHEIIAQAEGRPGWAVTLAALALAGDVDSLRNGVQLTRQVEAYLRRRGETDTGMDVLAAIAAIDGAADDDLRRLAQLVELRTPDVTRIIHGSARAGLLERAYDTWHVRPEPLRQALVADWYFSDEHRRGWEEVEEAFPDDSALWKSVAAAATMGSVKARRKLEQHLRASTSSKTLPANSLATFASLDENAAKVATRLVDTAVHAGDVDEPTLGTALAVYEKAASFFLLPGAIAGLLTLSEPFVGQLPLDRIPGLATVRRLCDRALPDIGLVPRAREAVLDATLAWLEASPLESRWAVAAAVFAAVIDPELRGSWVEPGNFDTITVVGGLESADRVDMIAKSLWPKIRSRLATAPPPAMVALIGGAEALLRVGKGIGPMGGPPPDDVQNAATSAGETVLLDLASSLGEEHPGLAAYVNRSARWFDLTIHVPLDADFALLCTDFLDDSDWEAKNARQHAALDALARRWASEDPDDVVSRLIGWLPEFDLAGGIHENWVAAALARLAVHVTAPTAWAETVLGTPLMPLAVPLLVASLEESTAGAPAWLGHALGDAGSRRAAVHAALAVETAATTSVLPHLTPDDVEPVYLAVLRRTAVDSVVAALLGHPVPAVALAAALGCNPDETGVGPGLPEELRPIWLAALSAPPDTIGGGAQLDRLRRRHLSLLRSQAPSMVVDSILQDVERAGNDAVPIGRLPREHREQLNQLPAAERERLARGLLGTPSALYFLSDVVGQDVDLVRRLLEEGSLGAQDALSALRGQRTMVRQLTPALVRAGAPHAAIAAAVLPTSWTGEMSSMYETAVAHFEDWIRDTDPDVEAVGNVGRERNLARAEEEREAERRRRVVGR